MAQGLNVADVVNVQIFIGPNAVATRNFGLLLIAGSTPKVIDTTERIRYYGTLSAVAADYATTTPEYLAASIYFSQQPSPPQVAIGYWAQTATSAVLHGAALSTAQQAMANFTAITTGGMSITIDGVAKNITGVSLAACTNLSQVAAAINTALGATGSCTWDGSRFNIYSATTGATSTIGYATAGTGTDMSSVLGLRTGQASPPVNGIASETALAAAQTFANITTSWYGLMFAPVTPLADADHLNLAAYIEGSSPARMYGFTTSNAAELASPNTTSLGYQLSQIKYAKTFWVYSTMSPYAAAGIFSRAFTVDFTGSNTTLTLKFKQIAGVAPETITESQRLALGAIYGNVYVNYNNGAAIIQEATMAGGRFFDEVHGLDWLQNYVQTGLFNLLYITPTKIPQTDAGVTTLLTQVENDLGQGVRNGLIAPGVWNVGGFGQLKQGDTLTKGYYVYAPPVSTQQQSERDARKAPTIQAAVKLAGAVHFANVILNVNR